MGWRDNGVRRFMPGTHDKVPAERRDAVATRHAVSCSVATDVEDCPLAPHRSALRFFFHPQ